MSWVSGINVLASLAFDDTRREAAYRELEAFFEWYQKTQLEKYPGGYHFILTGKSSDEDSFAHVGRFAKFGEQRKGWFINKLGRSRYDNGDIWSLVYYTGVDENEEGGVDDDGKM